MLLAQRKDIERMKLTYVFYIGEIRIEGDNTYLEGYTYIENKDFCLFLTRFEILKTLE